MVTPMKQLDTLFLKHVHHLSRHHDGGKALSIECKHAGRLAAIWGSYVHVMIMTKRMKKVDLRLRKTA